MDPIPADRRPAVDAAAFHALVAQAFAARRKTLRNALRMDEAALAALGLDSKLRPENLAPADYVRVCEALARATSR